MNHARGTKWKGKQNPARILCVLGELVVMVVGRRHTKSHCHWLKFITEILLSLVINFCPKARNEVEGLNHSQGASSGSEFGGPCRHTKFLAKPHVHYSYFVL